MTDHSFAPGTRVRSVDIPGNEGVVTTNRPWDGGVEVAWYTGDHGETVTAESVEDLVAITPRIEILHWRDPDSECSVELFINGESVTIDAYEDVDPGRGYEREDWDDRTETARHGHENYTEPFREALTEALEAAGESKYIEDPL